MSVSCYRYHYQMHIIVHSKYLGVSYSTHYLFILERQFKGSVILLEKSSFIIVKLIRNDYLFNIMNIAIIFLTC